MNRLLPVSEVARLLGVIGGVHTKVSKTLLELLDGLEYSLDENGSICFGNEESYREFFRRTERMAEQYGNKENSN